MSTFGGLFGSDEETSDAEKEDDGSLVPVAEVPGLFLRKKWCSCAAQEEIQDCIKSDGWFSHGNQAMHFGPDLPNWLLKVLTEMPGMPEIASRHPLFDQMILNRYHPGEGICAHVDLMRFEDGIAVISLGGPAVMHFTQPQLEPSMDVQVLLEGGDLMVLTREARWDWHHQIRGVIQEIFEPTGQLITRGVRTSITLRRMKEGIVLTETA